MRAFIILAASLVASNAYAVNHFSIQGALGFGAEADNDEVEFGNNTVDGDDEDLESNFGLIAGADWQVGPPGLRIGGRFGLMTAEGDDTENEYLTVAPGVGVRYAFILGDFAPFAGGGAGVTYARVEFDDFDGEVSGFGWHLFITGGLEYAINDSFGLIGTLTYTRHAVDPEGEVEGQGGGDIDVEIKDGVISRMLFAAGVTFL